MKALTLKNAIILLNERQKVLNSFESGLFPKGKHVKGRTSILDQVASEVKVCNSKVSDCKFSDCKQLKILTSKQMFQRLAIALAQVKVGNTFENSLIEIR